MARVTYMLPGGLSREAEVKPGYRVVSGAFALQLDEIGFGECGGNMTCGTCHVRVIEGEFEAARPDERQVLETFPKLYKESRLACQLRVHEGSGNIVVEWVG